MSRITTIYTALTKVAAAKPMTAASTAEFLRLTDLLADPDDVGHCDCCNRLDHLHRFDSYATGETFACEQCSS